MHRVLFFSRSQGYEHSVIKEKDGRPNHVQTVLTQLAPTNHVEFTFSKDGGIFTPENLAKYDAFFFYTTGDLTQAGGDHQPPMTPAQKTALLDAIRNGKGFVGVHSASDTFHSYGDSVDPYIAMLGAEFISHGAQQPSRLTCTDPCFPGLGESVKGLEMVEEWYSLKNFAPDLHVIFAQQTAGMTGWQYQRGTYPETFAHLYGKGRVFYSTLAHREDSWLKPDVQAVVLSGLHWVVGDTEADVTPNLTQTCPEANTLPVQPPATPKSQAAAPEPPNNTLTDAEKAAGWQLLFNGTDFAGWHHFKQAGVRLGWRVQDGAMACADPHTAGDLVTTQPYAWFELKLDYNIAPGRQQRDHVSRHRRRPAHVVNGPRVSVARQRKGSRTRSVAAGSTACTSRPSIRLRASLWMQPNPLDNGIMCVCSSAGPDASMRSTAKSISNTCWAAMTSRPGWRRASSPGCPGLPPPRPAGSVCKATTVPFPSATSKSVRCRTTNNPPLYYD